MHRFRLLTITAFLIANVHTLSAQEPPPFREAIRKFADTRLQIRTYELVLTIEEQGEPTVVLDIAADLPSDRLLVAKYQTDAEPELQRIDSRTPDFNISKRWIVPSRRARIDGFFDPLALGVALLGDMRRGTSLSEIAANYQDWWQLPSKTLADNAIRYGADDNEVYSIVLDPARGFSPVLLRAPTGHGGMFSVSQELTEVDGHWLPKRVVVDDSKKAQTMQFDWRTINADIGHRFLLDQIQKRYDGKLIDRR